MERYKQLCDEYGNPKLITSPDELEEVLNRLDKLVQDKVLVQANPEDGMYCNTWYILIEAFKLTADTIIREEVNKPLYNPQDDHQEYFQFQDEDLPSPNSSGEEGA